MRSTIRPGILLIGNYPPPFGGVPTHIEYLADHLARQVLNIKHSVLSLLGMISPRLAVEVLDRTKPADPEWEPDETATGNLPARRFSLSLPVVGFYGFAAAVLLMVALTVFG